MVGQDAAILLHTVVSGAGATGAAEGSEKMEKVRPIEVHKLCLVCRRSYPVEAERCDCGGRLYVSGVYRSNLRIGGGAGGQANKSGGGTGTVSQHD